ncbi:MAG: hypothetical protein QGI68_02635 [Pseudomonadales bacterium]|jgi:hypothetical protein|nr:hypothetical protein [Pseudomonadales bacterium]HJN50575.1 hypothetical protein [Pseudomonadales bacterium]|tara:strand:+ start:251 stop:661 length:411 start_codon:yes stop_codon:yes gene_type:complete
MSDEKIQAWLNGEGTEKPDSADLNLYQRLYASLAMEPEDRLPGTFSGQVADRVGLRNSHYSPDRVLVILIAIVMGFSSVAAVAVAVTYVPMELGMDLTPLKSVLRLPSDTWLFTGMVVLLLAGLDRLLLRSRIISH